MGFHPDPDGSGNLRWWNGRQWTETYQDAEPTFYQLCIHPAAWDRVKALIEDQWKGDFQIVPMPREAESDADVTAGIRTFMMTLR